MNWLSHCQIGGVTFQNLSSKKNGTVKKIPRPRVVIVKKREFDINNSEWTVEIKKSVRIDKANIKYKAGMPDNLYRYLKSIGKL